MSICYEGSERTSFVLYNTHSSPVRKGDQTENERDLGRKWLESKRQIDPSDTVSDDILDITYTSVETSWWTTGSSPYSNVDRHVLAPDTPVSVITPHHPLGEKRFVAPFFMEDRRHAFFVSTSQEVKWLQDFFDLGIVYNPGQMVEVTIPPLIAKPEEVLVKPNLWGDGGPVGPIGPDPGVAYSVGITEFVTQDAYIQQGLGTSGAVIYGDMQIGPSGGFAESPALQQRRAKKGGLR